MGALRRFAAYALLLLVLAACGDGSTTLIGGAVAPGNYLISGTISGLPAGQQVVLLDNGGDPTTISALGVFTFATPVARNGSYSVTVQTQPAGQRCTVSGGSGAGVTANVSSVSVTCALDTLTIGGTISGLGTGQSVTLQNNDADPTVFTADGAFVLAAPVAEGSSYSVTVAVQPAGQTCTVSGGTGAGVTANVTSLAVNCSINTYAIGGTVAGLATGTQVTLFNNEADPTTISANGAFTFAGQVAYDSGYTVTVGTQPTGQTCTVSGGMGAGVTGPIASVTVNCSTSTFAIGGTVSGLGAGDQVTLSNNSADALTVTANGAYTFPTPVVEGGSYSVTVGTQPIGQTCTVSGGAGAGVTAAVANIAVTCSTDTFSVGGTVSGLAEGQQVTLFNNATDAATVTANGTFTFATPVAYNGSYSVTVSTQPTGQTCTVSGGAGSGVTAAVATVSISCSTSTFPIGGTVSGLADGQQVTLYDNASDAATVTANGAFTFATPVAYDGSYSVTVSTQPTGQTCTVSGGSASGVTAAVSTVSVSCSTNTFPIGGMVSGLAEGQQVTLFNNATDAATVTANGSFTFTTPVTYNGSYSVTVSTQPTGQTCTVSGGAGSGVTAAVASVTVACSTNTFSIGGNVSGLASGQQVTLLNNGADALTVTANGGFTFATPVAYNGSYSVTVSTQPTGQTCSVSGGSASGVTATVAAVSVTCSTSTFSIGGTVSGLAETQQVTLYDNGTDAVTVTANGSFTFATPVTYDGSYSVTVSTQPTGQTCTVSGGSASGVTATVANVSVTCSTNTFSIGGMVSGLAADQQVTLLDNAADALTVTANGSFTFATPVTYNGSYSVTVSTQPTGQTCTVSGGSASGVTATVSTVSVTCSTSTFSIGGSVSGLASGQQVTLLNNGADALTVTANGAFTFATPVTYDGSYSVTVSTEPTGQTCSVSGGEGSGVTAAVAGITVTCATNTYPIGGTISGLASGQQVTLYDNGADALTVTANGDFTFATPVAYNGGYSVTVSTQPTGQTCTVSGDSGMNVMAAVTAVSVTCSTNTFTISGSVSGLTSGQQVTLLNNSANGTTVTANGAFTFSTPVAYNGSYSVTVGTQPTAENCTVTGGSGTGVTANVTGITITCTAAPTYSISGTVNMLSTGQQVTISVQLGSSAATDETYTANGSYTFLTGVPSGGSYTIATVTPPPGEFCNITHGSSGNVTANVSNVVVTCYAP